METPSLSEFFHFKATESSVTAAGFPPLSSFNDLSSAEEAMSGADSAPVLIEDVETDGDDDDEDLSGAESSDSDSDHDVCNHRCFSTMIIVRSLKPYQVVGCGVEMPTMHITRARRGARSHSPPQSSLLLTWSQARMPMAIGAVKML